MAGPLGYRDWQRDVNFDSPLLWDVEGTVSSGLNSPTMDVSKFAYVGGLMKVGITSSTMISFSWWADQALSKGVGGRNFFLDSSISANAQLRLPNLGPYLTVNTSVIGGSAHAHTIRLFGTNRVHPLEFIPGQNIPIDRQAIGVASGVADTVSPLDYYAGPVVVWLNTTQATIASLQMLNGAGAWDNVAQISTAGAANVTQTLVVPPGAWRMSYFNNAGVALTYYSTVAIPTTGAV